MARRSQVLQHLLVKLPDLLGLVELKKGIQIGCPFVFLVLYIDRGTILVGVGLLVRTGMGPFRRGRVSVADPEWCGVKALVPRQYMACFN